MIVPSSSSSSSHRGTYSREGITSGSSNEIPLLRSGLAGEDTNHMDVISNGRDARWEHSNTVLKMKNQIQEKDLQLLEMKTKGLKDLHEMRGEMKKKDLVLRAKDVEILRLQDKVKEVQLRSQLVSSSSSMLPPPLPLMNGMSSHEGDEEMRRLEGRLSSLQAALDEFEKRENDYRRRETAFQTQINELCIEVW